MTEELRKTCADCEHSEQVPYDDYMVPGYLHCRFNNFKCKEDGWCTWFVRFVCD